MRQSADHPQAGRPVSMAECHVADAQRHVGLYGVIGAAVLCWMIVSVGAVFLYAGVIESLTLFFVLVSATWIGLALILWWLVTAYRGYAYYGSLYTDSGGALWLAPADPVAARDPIDRAHVAQAHLWCVDRFGNIQSRPSWGNRAAFLTLCMTSGRVVELALCDARRCQPLGQALAMHGIVVSVCPRSGHRLFRGRRCCRRSMRLMPCDSATEWRGALKGVALAAVPVIGAMWLIMHLDDLVPDESVWAAAISGPYFIPALMAAAFGLAAIIYAKAQPVDRVRITPEAMVSARYGTIGWSAHRFELSRPGRTALVSTGTTAFPSRSSFEVLDVVAIGPPARIVARYRRVTFRGGEFGDLLAACAHYAQLHVDSFTYTSAGHDSHRIRSIRPGS